MAEKLLCYLARTVIALLQALPLTWVAQLGRCGGIIVYLFDARHRHVAVKTLTLCFGHEKSPAEIRAIARESFRRIGENYASAIKTFSMPWPDLTKHIEQQGMDKVLVRAPGDKAQSRILALGHFGCFELYAHYARFVPSFKFATTYRSLRQPSLNQLMQSMRERSGCLFFERRTGGTALRAMLSKTGSLLGLLCDQHAGDHGLRLPFFGHDCSTSPAPAVFALRYRCPLHTSICYRVGLGRWRIETGDEIPTHENGQRRSIEAIMRDVNLAFEKAIRRDPANWFWVHNRWKAPPPPKPGAKAEDGELKMENTSDA